MTLRLLADSELSWLTEERKKRLQRRSTILLVAALSVSLICLFRTNELSGSVIGSLGDKAEEADRKAREAITDSSTALSQATDALTKAGKAADSLGKAEREANKAQTASSNALTLARGARQDSDSFEKDIVSAKTLATEAESHLADALREAKRAEEELKRILSPRSLTNLPELIAALKPFKGSEYTLNVFQDDEAIQFTKAIDEALGQADWIRKSPGVLRLGITSLNVFRQDIKDAVPICIETGIQIHVQAKDPVEVLQSRPIQDLPKTLQVAIALRSALISDISPSDERNVGDRVLPDREPDEGPILICVGKKP
jgi:hypothetical protein